MAKLGRPLQSFQQEKVKQHIQTTQLLKRVQNYALGDLEMDYPRVQACFKLLEFRLSKAIPEAIEANQQAQAIQAIQHAQLQAMALEMLQMQGIDMPASMNTLTEDSSTLAEDAYVIDTMPTDVEITTDVSE